MIKIRIDGTGINYLTTVCNREKVRTIDIFGSVLVFSPRLRGNSFVVLGNGFLSLSKKKKF